MARFKRIEGSLALQKYLTKQTIWTTDIPPICYPRVCSTLGSLKPFTGRCMFP